MFRRIINSNPLLSRHLSHITTTTTTTTTPATTTTASTIIPYHTSFTSSLTLSLPTSQQKSISLLRYSTRYFTSTSKSYNYKSSPFLASTTFHSTKPQFRRGGGSYLYRSRNSIWQKLFDAVIGYVGPTCFAVSIIGGYSFVLKTELKTDMQGLKTDIKGLETRLTNDIKGLEKQFTHDMKGLEKQLTNDMKGLEKQFTHDMKGLETRLTNLEISQTSLKTDIQELETRLTHDMNDIKTLLQQLVQHDVETRTKFSYIEHHYIHDRHHVKNDV